MAIILLVVLIGTKMANNSIDQITLLYAGLLFLGAVVVHIVTTLDTLKQASEGAFSMDERSASFLVKEKER